MPVHVRNTDGELAFRSVEEVRNALAAGLVDPSDEVRLSDAEPWRPVAEVVGRPSRWRWKDHYHWLVLAGVLTLLLVLGAGLLWVVLAVSSHALWMVTVRRGRRQSTRWW